MNTTVVDGAGIRLTIVAPPRDLAPYITAFYRTEIGAQHAVEDFLPPEGANLRAGRAAVYEAAIGADPMRRVPPTVVSGPTSRVTRLRIRDGRFWGVGLLPLGFAKFIGVPATDLADRFCDAAGHASTAPLHALLEHLADSRDGIDQDLARMHACFRGLLARPLAQADAIVATHRALVCDDSPSVASVAAAVGVSTRTLERLCARHFGFAPQLLLRRQRFLRSLGKFMVDPSMKWIHSLDCLYHDQAHFSRDFKRFLGMRPSEYAAMPHPIAMTAARGRSVALGDTMQVLHRPEPAA